MKLSDYVADFLAGLSVRDIFLISGGGMMHLLDSVGKHPAIRLVCNLNEQASSICADSAGQYTGNLGVCLLTTGPGGTNAMTGVAASYLDSTPVLVISGQCKTADFASRRGVRSFGAQEVDVTAMARPVTKYAVTVTDPDSIRYHLEKAVYLARHGRKGPVWVDVPLDVQGAQIDPSALRSFSPEQEGLTAPPPDFSGPVQETYALLQAARRPAVLIGGGLVLSGAREEFLELCGRLQIPVLSTWRAKDVLPHDDPLYFGMPGIPAPRYANYILQNCDFLLILGTRLNPALTAYDEPHFAFQAKKVMVDIDEKEIEKLDMPFALTVAADAGDFVRAMLAQANPPAGNSAQEWLAFCRKMKQKYPLENELQPLDNEGLTDGYRLAREISRQSRPEDVFVGSSSGRTCGISHMALELKSGQRFISSMGLGSMGFTVPSAIACCLASGRRTIALEGDGSLQHNLQELQLIQTYQLPVKLFILSNRGYASIYMMQKNNFQSRFAACDPATHVVFPSLRDVAGTYGLDYLCIPDNSHIPGTVRDALKDNRPVLCEVLSSIYFDEIPKSKTIAHPDGTFSSCPLENLYPFVSEEEQRENMPDWGDTP